MKKLITIFMCLALCLSLFVACGNKEGGEEQQSTGNDLASAGDYLFINYDGMMTRSIPAQITADLIRMYTLEGDIVEVYLSWAAGGLAPWKLWLDIILGVVLFAVGIIGSYLLVKYQRQKDAEAAEMPASQEE